METETSTVEVLGIGADAAVQGLKQAGGKAWKGLVDFFGGPN